MDRQRLTITLRDDLISGIDEIIDGVEIRNRSHAIEYLLSKALSPKISQALILAGGPGVKLRPLTYEIPKPLIPLHGRPLITYTLDLLRDQGIRDIVLAIGHMGEKIREEIGNGQKYGVKIVYSEEQRHLGSAGSVLNAVNLLKSKPFIVINGDILTDIDFKEMIRFHQEEKFLATIALNAQAEAKGSGSVLLRGKTVMSFLEKSANETTHLIDAGIYIFNPGIFSYIPKKGNVSLDKIFPLLVKEGKVAGYPFEGLWFDISTPKNYERAIKEWGK